MFGTPEHTAWAQVIQRCYNPKHPAWLRYGGRGITVCERWRYQQDNGDGRPAVDQLSHTGDDPLLEALKEGKR
jgi:hypothetical protein